MTMETSPVPHAATRPIYVPESAQVAQSLLAELKGAHRALLSEMANMESVTSKADMDQMRCVAARWKISQASLSRRTLAARICDYFLVRSPPAETAALRALRDDDQALLRRSASYVAAWSNSGIAADWAGYCAASRDIRVAMHDQIGREQRVLFPLLERLASRR